MGVELEGRELDAAVATEVMELKGVMIDEEDGEALYKALPRLTPYSFVPNYSLDIAAAMQVLLKLEEIDPNAIIRVSNGDGDSCDCDILADAFSKLQSAHVSIEDGTLKDAPLAICRAALKAVEAE